jgi:NAD(P)-dependent dehydrogenase (short-subunit alcohol dehydrogenase family)
VTGTVLITGASAGIGEASAHLLAENGWKVFGASRKQPANPGALPFEWVRMDVRDEHTVRAGFEEVRRAARGLDALVCNAGYGIFGSVEEVPLDTARAQFETNFFGTLATLRAVVPHMREAGEGRIVVVGSLAGRAPIPFQAHYSASKAAVDALSMALGNELRPYGVRVSLVEPGDIRTSFNDATDWGERSQSSYGDRLRRCEEVVRDSLPQAPGPEIVAQTILTALTAQRPRVRYTVGPASRLVPFSRRLLPDRWAQRLISAHFKV